MARQKQRRYLRLRQDSEFESPCEPRYDPTFPVPESYGIYIALCLILLIGSFVFKDYLLLKRLYLFQDIGSDTLNVFYPQFIHIANYLRTDGIPMWSFHQGMGQSIFPADINNPFTLILYFLGADLIPYAIGYLEYFKVLLGGMVVYFYLTTLGVHVYVRIIGSLLFAFSSIVIAGSGWYNHATLAVYGAFLLFSFERLFQSKSWIWLPLATALLSTNLAHFYFFSLFLLAYAITRHTIVYGWKPKRLFLFLLWVAGVGALGLGMNFVFSSANLLTMINSPRVTGEASFYDVLISTHLLSLEEPIHYTTAVMRLFSSDLLGTGSMFKGWQNFLEAPMFYCGLPSLLLIPQLLIVPERRRAVACFALLGFWMLLIMFPFFRYAFYAFTGDYYKGGLSIFVSLTLIALSTKSLDHIVRHRVINFRHLLLTLALLMVALFYPYKSLTDSVDPTLRTLIALLLILYTLLLNQFTKAPRPTLIAILFLAVLSMELAVLSSVTTHRRMTLSPEDLKRQVGYNDYSVDAVKYLKSVDKSFYRINKTYYSGPAIHTSFNDAKIQGYYGTPSYESFNSKHYIRFLGDLDIVNSQDEHQTRWAVGLISRPLLQTVGSVKYNLSKESRLELTNIGYEVLKQIGDVIIFENRKFLPLGFTYDKVIRFEDFKKLPTAQKDVALFRAAVVFEKDEASFAGLELTATEALPLQWSWGNYEKDVLALRENTLVIKEHSHNHIVGNIELTKRKLLFFSIPYDEGWSVAVDGKKSSLAVINVGFMGLMLDSGNHHVELRFRPPLLRVGMMISILSTILYIVLALKAKNMGTIPIGSTNVKEEL